MRPRLAQKNIPLLHDNAPSHTAAASVEVINSYKWQLMFHPPYSPDLAPCDFYLFPELKKSACWKEK
jgi:histone-lysine N-methyltransferase SETMAR